MYSVCTVYVYSACVYSVCVYSVHVCSVCMYSDCIQYLCVYSVPILHPLAFLLLAPSLLLPVEFIQLLFLFVPLLGLTLQLSKVGIHLLSSQPFLPSKLQTANKAYGLTVKPMWTDSELVRHPVFKDKNQTEVLKNTYIML